PRRIRPSPTKKPPPTPADRHGNAATVRFPASIPCRAHFIWSLAARHARAGASRERTRVYSGAGVRDPRRREGGRARRTAAPSGAELRGRRGEHDRRADHRTSVGGCACTLDEVLSALCPVDFHLSWAPGTGHCAL